MSKILGISAFYHDSAATILVDGKIIAVGNEAVEEISDWLASKNWKVINTIESCITGTKGNHEYFIYSVKEEI